MDRSVDASSAGQLAIGRVDDGIDRLGGDVALLQFQEAHGPMRTRMRTG